MLIGIFAGSGGWAVAAGTTILLIATLVVYSLLRIYYRHDLDDLVWEKTQLGLTEPGLIEEESGEL